MISRWFESNLSHINIDLNTISKYNITNKFNNDNNNIVNNIIINSDTNHNTSLNYIRQTNTKITSALLLTFKRNKLFLNLLSFSQSTCRWQPLLTVSLGLLAKLLKVKKSLKTSKATYLKVVEFARQVIILIENTFLELHIQGVPKFLNELLRELFKKSDKVIINPLVHTNIPSSIKMAASITFSKVKFINNFAYYPLKTKKLGRVKRKIRRRIFASNNIID